MDERQEQYVKNMMRLKEYEHAVASRATQLRGENRDLSVNSQDEVTNDKASPRETGPRMLREQPQWEEAFGEGESSRKERAIREDESPREEETSREEKAIDKGPGAEEKLPEEKHLYGK